MRKSRDREGPCGCQGRMPGALTRRQLLKSSANGFGMFALSSLLADWAPAAVSSQPPPHFAAKAKNVIFCFMDGGVSHVDSFDPKPALTEHDGQIVTKVENPTASGERKWLRSPWKFKQYGACGLPVSELFPHVATCADELAVIRSMKSDFPLHPRGNLLLHTGRTTGGSPSLGSWVTYGLGTENHDLPGFVVLNNRTVPPGGMENFANGFLPASHQATLIAATGAPIENLAPADKDLEVQRTKLDLIAGQDKKLSGELGGDDAVESAIRNYELAFRMQSLVPDVLDLSGETEATKRLYGLDSSDEHKQLYGVQCLRARRLVESGVRFVEVCTVLDLNANGTWDQHSDLKANHEKNAFVTDQAIAGLLKDLKARGMLDETLVIWAGEFGRTPHASKPDGRDHHPEGYTVWLAGGGVKGGTVYGATDELGMHAVKNVVSVHDLHATMLRLLGLDHERLSYRFGGIDFRLTNVHGHVVEDLIA